VLVAEVLYVQFVARRNKSAINKRLRRLSDGGVSQKAALQTLLKERGLSESGDYSLGLVWLNRLYAQSGVTGSPYRYFGMFAGAGFVIALVLGLLRMPLPALVAVFFVVGLLVPFWLLRRARTRRLTAFERQLPDALDMIIRSLRAGHPTSVAVSLVAREMSDPIGSEFGIASDEVAFGSPLETAIRKMAERVGFEGLQLLSVALSIQARTGGNLTEILDNLSKVLRARLMLRLKVRALASEGKVSAILMSLFPLVMFGILLLIAPTYYGAIWGDPLVLPVFAAFGAWALFGDFIMYRMVNFDF
jgi:tight adherence protein B